MLGPHTHCNMVRSQLQTTTSPASKPYNRRIHQECFINNPQPPRSVELPQSAKDLLARTLGDECQYSYLSQISEMPLSMSRGNDMARQLDSKGSGLDIDTYRDSELDISLGHETRSVGSNLSDVSDHGIKPHRHSDSPRHMAQTCRQSPKSAATHYVRPDSCLPAEDLMLKNKNMNHPDGVHTNASSDAKPLRELPSPINSTRLRPIREKTKNAVVNILNNGWTCLEFFKANDEDNIREVVKISPDGLTIQLYQPNTPGANKPAKEYSYHNLPQKYVKKYQYAAKFVNLVKSRTAKVTLYTKRAKCMLMENNPQPDFDVLFYDGAKCCQTADTTRIITKDGTKFTLVSVQGEKQLSHTAQELRSYMQECHSLCKQLETILESVEKDCTGDMSYFPITVGRRPAPSLKDMVPAACINQPQKAKAHQGHEQITNESLSSTLSRSSKSQQVANPICKRNQSTSTQPVYITPPKDKQGVTSPSSQKSAPVVLCKVFVQDIGHGRQLSNGEVSVQFLDGSEIAIQSSPMMVRFSDNRGYRKNFWESDQLPLQVTQKLEMLPAIMLRLEAANLAAKAKMNYR